MVVKGWKTYPFEINFRGNINLLAYFGIYSKKGYSISLGNIALTSYRREVKNIRALIG
jgi:hypothetical protein